MAEWQQLFRISIGNNEQFNGVKLNGYGDWSATFQKISKNQYQNMDQAILSIKKQFEIQDTEQIQSHDNDVQTFFQALKKCFNVKVEDQQKLKQYFKIDKVANHKTIVYDGNTFISIFEDPITNHYYHIFYQTS